MSAIFLYSQVPCKEEDDVSASSDSLGEQLFELVDVYNTGHSQKITGKSPDANTITCSINKASETYNQHLSCFVFRILLFLLLMCPIFPGMLLEQHKDAVLKLLSDPKLMEEQVNSALRILKE